MAKETLSSASVNEILAGVGESGNTGLTQDATTIAATVTGTIEVFDKNGNSLGYVALYDSADLT